MELSDIFIYALRELHGFDEEYIAKALELAKHDVVETEAELIDFINFNIEEKKFPRITQPYEERTIRKAIEKARKNEGSIVHHLGISDEGFPHKFLQTQRGHIAPIAYKGKLKNLNQKTIMITGSSSPTKNARLASKYLGKLLGSNGYNLLTTISDGCEQSAIAGCKEVAGISTFFLSHRIESMTTNENEYAQSEIEAGRSVVISVSNTLKPDEESIEDSFRYLIALADCLIVPQISLVDSISRLVKNFLVANKPVFLVRYKLGNGLEYDCASYLESRGAKFLSGNTALSQVQSAIGAASEYK